MIIRSSLFLGNIRLKPHERLEDFLTRVVFPCVGIGVGSGWPHGGIDTIALNILRHSLTLSSHSLTSLTHSLTR